MKIFLYRLCQCTYGLLQTLLGFLMFLKYIKNPHYTFHGAIVTEWHSGSSLSLGMFLFVSTIYKEKPETRELYDRLVVHEYGHTIQSLLLGPLYLIVIGLPSVLWAALPFLRKRRRERKISYYSFYTESWANAWGEMAAKEKSMGQYIS
ncbi:MAG: hypothetical protein K2N36_00900 [Ruminiclostridium sp.]|nr:hypothetical protein [Ruminiclostridium sp.]